MDYADHAETIPASQIIPLHEVRDAAKLARLVESMDSAGWQGRPLLVVADGNGAYVAMTGSHRHAAAVAAGLESVPCVVVPAGGDLYVNWRNDVVMANGSEDGNRLTDDDERLAACRTLGLDVAAALIATEIEAAQ